MPSLSTAIPKYRPPRAKRLPPVHPIVFRSVIQHPPPPFIAKTSSESGPTSIPGPEQVLYTTAPRPTIPLTMSPVNHLLWNPPAADAKASRAIERDESGRLARFASRWTAGIASDEQGKDEVKVDQFAPEADLSFLEGETLQSPNKALGKKDIVGVPKAPKKGRK